MELQLSALFKSKLDGTIAHIEEATKEELFPTEMERFSIDTFRPVKAKSLAEEVVKSFHARNIGAEHMPYSPSVSHVILFRTGFRSKVIILSEEKSISVIAFRLT